MNHKPNSIFEAAQEVLEGKWQITVGNLEIGFKNITKFESDLKKFEAERIKARDDQEYYLWRYVERVEKQQKKLRQEYRDMIEIFEGLAAEGKITKKHLTFYIDLLEERIPVFRKEVTEAGNNFAMKTNLAQLEAALVKAKAMKIA